MAFGKKAKTPKTQYQTEQQELGRAAYPYIEPQRQRIADLTNNADAYRQKGINNYFNTSATWNDALRNYQRQMAQATANNYNATGGGYSSAAQRYYDDVQRNQNDYNARLYDRGVNIVESMLGNDRNAAINYYNLLNNQHAYAAQPDAIDTANELIDKSNKNVWSNMLQQGGKVVSMIPTPWTRAIGAGMQLGGWAGSQDYSNAISNVLNSADIKSDSSAYANPAANLGTTLGGIVSQYQANGGGDRAYWSNLFKRGGKVGTVTTGSGGDFVPAQQGEPGAIWISGLGFVKPAGGNN